jgi:hypothetical protein
MAKTFEELKLEGGKELARLQAERRLNLGSHKRTRLKRAGCGESGTLLHDEVAERHANTLRDEYMNRFEQLARGEADERLRFLTVLHSVVGLDKKAVMRAIEGMEAALGRVFDGSDTWALGAVEVEIVNVELLRRIGAGSDDEARKLKVLQRLHETEALDASAEHSSSRALVHFHGIVDLVNGNSALREELLRKRAKEIVAWQRSPYQVELKRLFENRTVLQNVQVISRYLTKGGNDRLRYNAGFGRELEEDLDTKLWRAGMGRADKGGEAVADERGLNVGEIMFLDEIWRTLMDRNRSKRGYLLRLG